MPNRFMRSFRKCNKKLDTLKVSSAYPRQMLYRDAFLALLLLDCWRNRLGRTLQNFRRALMRVSGRLVLGIALIVLGLDFTTFDLYDVPTDARVHRASAAVVFTGSFERVDAALQLLDASAVPRLYISGANAGVGIHPVTFVSQFAARNPSILNLQRLAACCLELGESANNTLQNAREVKCWLDRRRLTGPLLLITSEGHMARSMAALSGEVGSRVLIPYPVHDGLPWGAFSRVRVLEYLKYLGTFVAVHTSGVIGVRRLYGPFADRCPSSAFYAPPRNTRGSESGL
ncbi:hypothetical protein AMST5_03901 [freshwater sediment metagenome]|uniref:DUF218 domain-containing protein n=1 Tax=freshwater sediment metagenome TaxID=556182 RepID=A0AA48M5F8_9ZZZZ